MKTLKYILSVLSIFILNTLYAQNGSVGINTTTPNASSVLDITSNPTGSETHKGVLFPRMTTTQRNAIVDPANGLMIYNTSISCLQVNDGTTTLPIWNCISGNTGSGTVASLNCASATHNGTLKINEAASGVSSTIPYTNGNGSSYNAQSVSSTGVTGLTATLEAGNFVNGSGSLTYKITGTPNSTGSAFFTINIGGQTCTFTRNVTINVPTSIELSQNRTYIVASIYDQDYLPYTAPTGPATTTTLVNSDGSNEAVTVNVQGTIPTAGVNIKIPVTATGSGTLPAYSQTITIPANLTEEGTSSVDLTLSWTSQAYTTLTKTINATIAAVGGTLNAKKLDINAGVGNDALGVLMGQFTYPYNNAGNTTTYSVRDIAGIPDKMFGLPDNNSNSTTHLMLYIPVVAEDGNIWLNNNLGAHYANINHASFNPAKQATSATDYLAYGSLIQWGREPDGHELITYTNANTGNVVNGNTSTKSDAPADAKFILEQNNSPYDWRSTQDPTLWATEASENNPCPKGFRVPTLTEQNTLVTAASITNSASAASSTLKFTVPGFRSGYFGTLYDVGSYGYYWNSTVSGTGASYRNFVSGATYTNSYTRAYGLTVRCLKD